MNDKIEVSTQKKFDKVIKEENIPVVKAGIWKISGNSHVNASGNSIVNASSPNVIIKKLSKNAKCKGKHIITVKSVVTIKDWLNSYGLKSNKRGVVILYKTVNYNYKSKNNGDYTPGTIPEAKDWDNGEKECGGGLHFCPVPFFTKYFDSNGTKFIACPVNVKDMRKPKENDYYPNKIKAKKCCGPVWECDINGKKISPGKQGEKF